MPPADPWSYGVESQDPETPQYLWLGGYRRTWDQTRGQGIEAIMLMAIYTLPTLLIPGLVFPSARVIRTTRPGIRLISEPFDLVIFGRKADCYRNRNAVVLCRGP